MIEVGIGPCSLGDPLPGSIPPPPPPEAPAPILTEEDARWLLNLGVMWEHEPEPGFIPPKTLPEYLARYPTGIREAVEAAASELGLALPHSDLAGLAQQIEEMFVGFAAADLEDVVALYPFHQSLRPGGFTFDGYMKFRVKACMETVLKLGPPSGRNRGDSFGP